MHWGEELAEDIIRCAITAIIYASKHAHVFTNKPDLECTSCGTRILVYPVSTGCISVTLRQAKVWYDQQMLVAIAAAQYAGPTAKLTAQPFDSFICIIVVDQDLQASGPIASQNWHC